MGWRSHQHQQINQNTKIKYSPDDDYNNDNGSNVGPTNAVDDDIIEEGEDSPYFDVDDPDGVALVDTNERATLFGLEPRADVDPFDNGLQFTGLIILLFSIIVTLCLFFADDMPPLHPIEL